MHKPAEWTQLKHCLRPTIPAPCAPGGGAAALADLQDVFAFKEGLPAPPGLKLLAETGDLSTLGVSRLVLGSVVRHLSKYSTLAVSSVCCCIIFPRLRSFVYPRAQLLLPLE